jgi:hypothetical protein
VKDTNIAPGSTGEVSVRIDVGQLEGPQKVLFVVKTNDSESPTVSLQIEFDVEGRFWVEPRSIALGAVAPQGDIPPRLVKVRWQKQRKVVLKGVTSNDTWVQVSSRPFAEGAIEGVDLELTFGPFEVDSQVDYSRSLRTTIEIETNQDSNRKVLIPVTASLQRAVVMAPRILELGVVGVGQKLHDVIDVRSVTGQPFRILEVTSSAPYIRTQVEEVVPGLRYSVKLWIEPLEPLGAVETVITVKTDAPFCEELGCRITGVVNP